MKLDCPAKAKCLIISGTVVLTVLLSSFNSARATPLPGSSARNKLTAEALSLFSQNQFKPALEKFIAAYEANEDPPLDCFHQAVCYYKLGEQQRARQMFTFVVDNFSKSEPAKSARTWLADAASWTPGRAARLALAAGTTANTVHVGNAMVASTGTIPGRIYVPYTTDAQGLMVVNVFLNGQPIPAYFDTGAEVTLFTASQLARAGITLPPTSGSAVTLTGIAGQSQARQVEVNMSMGNLLTRLRILVQDDTSLIRNQGATASIGYPLIGQDYFGPLTYSIDDRAHVISFFTEPLNNHDQNAVPFTVEGKAIIVKPKVNGRECEMILDTGAATVSFSDLQLSAIGMSRPTSAGRGAAVGVGGKREAYLFPVSSISLGVVEKKQVTSSCNIYGTGPKPLLGRSFLKGLKITVDPRAHLLHIE